MKMDIFLHPNHSVRCMNTSPAECGKPSFLTNLFLNLNEFDKIYIYSPFLHHDLHQTLIKCFTNFISITTISKIFNEEVLYLIIEEAFNDKNFEKLEIEIKTNESKE